MREPKNRLSIIRSIINNLKGIALSDLTQAERNIILLLKSHGYVKVDLDGDKIYSRIDKKAK